MLVLRRMLRPLCNGKSSSESATYGVSRNALANSSAQDEILRRPEQCGLLSQAVRDRQLRNSDQAAHDFDAGELIDESGVEAHSGEVISCFLNNRIGLPSQSEVRKHATGIELRRSEEAELRVDNADSARCVKPTAREVIAMDERLTIAQVHVSKFGNL